MPDLLAEGGVSVYEPHPVPTHALVARHTRLVKWLDGIAWWSGYLVRSAPSRPYKYPSRPTYAIGERVGRDCIPYVGVYDGYGTKSTPLHFASSCLCKRRMLWDKVYTSTFRLFVFMQTENVMGQSYTPTFRLFVFMQTENVMGQSYMPTFRLFVFVETENIMGQSYMPTYRLFVFMQTEMVMGQVYTPTLCFFVFVATEMVMGQAYTPYRVLAGSTPKGTLIGSPFGWRRERFVR